MKKKDLIQQFECLVIRTTNEVVECEMHDLTDEEKPVEYSEIYRSFFNNFDSSLLTEGRVFYLNIFKKNTDNRNGINDLYLHEFTYGFQKNEKS